MHKSGRRVLLYLLVPRSTKYFIPSTIQQLVATDVSAANTSKKTQSPVEKSSERQQTKGSSTLLSSTERECFVTQVPACF